MANPEGRPQNLLIFHSSGLDCAFPLEAVREIVPMATLSSPPGLPSGLAGFLDLRGTAIPIVRLDRLFDLPEQQPGLHTPMIVLRGASRPDRHSGGIGSRHRASALFAAVGDTGRRHFQGCATAALELDGDLIHLLSPAALLEANEARLLADYSAMAQARLLHMPEADSGERI